jgi:DNA-binding response OmpR family regulator
MKGLEGHCILVVEDEFYLAKDLQYALTQAGATILGPFPRREEALAAMARSRPDCAIIDVNLGRGANFELADELVRQGVPFLFFTGYDQAVIPQRFSKVMRLEKPVDTTRLVNAAQAACSRGECRPI